MYIALVDDHDDADVQAYIGRPFMFECSVSAYPSAAIRWYRNSTPLVPKHNQVMVLYDGECKFDLSVIINQL